MFKTDKSKHKHKKMTNVSWGDLIAAGLGMLLLSVFAIGFAAWAHSGRM